MNILFELGHPAHVHLFKNTIFEFMRKNHNIKIVIREREQMVGPLLDHYGLKYDSMCPNATGIIKKILTIINNDLKLLKISKKFNPDIFVTLASPYSALISAIMQKPHIGLADTEDFPGNKIIIPITDVILTPDCYLTTFPSKKHIKYHGYHELAYLHPNWFRPDSRIFEILGLKAGEKYVILRFGAFDAAHDMGIKGFSSVDKRRLVEKLKKYARIFISSESPLHNSLKKYIMNIPPEKMHDAIYYASLMVGDTGTMSTEAACLGTPSILFHPKVKEVSNHVEMENKYGLIFGYNRDVNNAINKAVELIQKPTLKLDWQEKRKILFKDKIDVTKLLIWFIENYPESHKIMKEKPDYQNKFK